MKTKSQHAQGNIKFGGEDEEEKGLLELDFIIEQTQTNLDRDDGSAERGDEF